MRNYIYLSASLYTSAVLAAGGFEKPVLWSARAAQHGGAYASAVSGAEALLYNPAALFQEQKIELAFAGSATFGASTGPIIQEKKESRTYNGPITPVGFTSAYQINDHHAVGLGVYSIGGMNVSYNDLNFSSLGPEFNSFRPDVFGKLAIVELGLGYAYKINPNLSLGLTLRNHYAKGDLSQVSVLRARGLGGMGVTDGTVLAVSRGGFKDLEGFRWGQYTLGAKYLSDRKESGWAIVYRSKLKMNLRAKSNGDVVYSNAGAAPGITAGQTYKYIGSTSTVSSSLPQSLTLSAFKKLSQNNTAHLEYSWANYANNKKLAIDGKVKDPNDGTTMVLPDLVLNWKDLHDFKLGWTNTSFDSWILGGGYSLALPVTDKNAAGATFAVPSVYHHFYTGVGKLFEGWRMDAGYEYIFGNATGVTAGTDTTAGAYTTPLRGDFKTRAYAFYLSSSIYF